MIERRVSFPHKSVSNYVVACFSTFIIALWICNFQHDVALRNEAPSIPLVTEELKGSIPYSDIVELTNTNSPFRTRTGSHYAYVWVIGSFHENHLAYKGFFFDVLISASLLRKFGSKADFWLITRLSPNSSLQAIPYEDRRHAAALGINIHQLPKLSHESFSQLMYDKFTLLKMTNYRRVMFLDADVMPLVDLDYLFHLSDPLSDILPTLLKPNFIIASRGEPCNGGMFMLEPLINSWKKYEFVVAEQHSKARNLSYPHFDRMEGWGYSFVHHDDQWEAILKSGNRWHFHGAHVDQGLLYYFAKFICKNVSISIGSRLQSWQGHDYESPELENEGIGVLGEYQESVEPRHHCDFQEDSAYAFKCTAPHSGVFHFHGKLKPWQGTFDISELNSSSKKHVDEKHLWFRELVELNSRLDIGINMQKWNTHYLPMYQVSPLGYMPWYKDQGNIIGIET